MLACLEDGLGIKNLETQNYCLLIKFVHQVFNGASVAWRDWLLRDIGRDNGGNISAGSFIGRIVNEELDCYRPLTRVRVHNGESTSFWYDDQLGFGPHSNQYPTLFSHVTHPYTSVAATLVPTFSLPLCPRLSRVAVHNMTELSNRIATVSLDDEADERVIIWGRPPTPRKLPTGALLKSGSMTRTVVQSRRHRSRTR